MIDTHTLRPALGATLVLALACGAGAQDLAPGTSPSETKATRSVRAGAPDAAWLAALLREQRSGRVDEPGLRAAVEGAGPEALPVVFAALCGDAAFAGDEDGPLIEARSLAVLEQSLRSWPAEEVLAGLAQATRDASLARRWVALRLVAEVQDAGAPALVFALVSGMRPEHRADGRTTRAVREALVGILARRPEAFGEVSALDWDGTGGEPLALAVIEALGETADGRALDLLVDCLGTSSERDAAVLTALACLAPWEPECAGTRRAGSMERFLIAPEPRLRRAAARAMAALRYEGAYVELVEMLEDTDAGVRHEAHRALRALTGCDFPLDAVRWDDHGVAEEVWWEERAEPLFEAARGPAVGPAVRALDELARHRLFARRIAPRLVDVLAHESPVVVRAACRVLTSLEDASVAPALAEARKGVDPELQPALDECLSTLSGEPVEELAAWCERLRR